MKNIFTLLFSVGILTSYGQYNYVPQIPLEALRMNLEYKQRVYNQRQDQLQQRIDYISKLMMKLNQEDHTVMLKALNDNLITINQMDFFDNDVYNQINDWLDKLQASVIRKIP